MTELWDIYDGQARRTGRTMKRGIPADGDYMMCVHIYVYNSSDMFLMQKRSYRKETHPGEWDVTAGAVLSGEESIDGALRETKEETGISIKSEDMYFAGRFKKKNKFIDIFFVKSDFNIEDCILQKDEVEEVKLVSADDMIDIEKNLRKREKEYMSIIYRAINHLGIALCNT